MKQQWITDRLPTAADGDMDGDVRIRRAPGSDATRLTHWSYVQPDMDWQRSSFWQPPVDPDPVEPAPTASRQVVQITGGDNWLVALCNDGTLLQLAKGTWTELPAIPQP